MDPLDTHLRGMAAALGPYRAVASGRLARWGAQLAHHLGTGGRLLVAGNGGSAAALDRARQCYDWSAAATRLDALYRELQPAHASEVLAG